MLKMQQEMSKLLFAVSLVALLFSAGRGAVNVPPTIKSLSTNIGSVIRETFTAVQRELDHPSHYLLVAKNGYDHRIVYNITCKATNAEELVFEYKATAEETEFTEIPNILEEDLRNSSKDGELELEIFDGTLQEVVDLKKMNGYYRCVAKSGAGKYVAMSATFRIVLFYFQSPGIPQKDIGTVGGNAYMNKPYYIPCRDPASSMEIIQPPCEHCPIEDWISYEWDIIYDGRRRRLDLDDDEYKDRIMIEPRTGDLLFTYTLKTDQPFNFECSIRVDSSDSETVAYWKDFPSISSNYNATKVSFLSPRPEDVQTADGVSTVKKVMKCTEGGVCSIICIFGGILGRTAKIKANKAGDMTNSANASTTGFKFVAQDDGSAFQTWQCHLYNTQKNIIYKTLNFPVKVLLYPKLKDDDSFRQLTRVREGGDVKFICDAKVDEESSTTFFFNGRKVTPEYPVNVLYDPDTTDTEFEIKNVTQEHVASILCETTNEAGSLYVTAQLLLEP